MPKMSAKNESEFAELSAYVSLFATVVWGIPETANTHPSHYMAVVPGGFSKSKLLAGLRQAANDTIEASQNFTGEQLAIIDAAFKSKNVITLSEVRRRYWNKYKSVIKRGRILNETEYCLTAGLLSDVNASISVTERVALEALVSAFESRIAQLGIQADLPSAGRLT